ncbi:5-formyltetrahydrofolate cyclo-ligase, partial [Dietzia sp. SLG510A3-3B2-2]|nr:5-formyltetrahydrofolate cyclo-ligase [Dietzia sp. SLG510A3-3B2-2]
MQSDRPDRTDETVALSVAKTRLRREALDRRAAVPAPVRAERDRRIL